MMPNTEWVKNFECHFDPSIKNYDPKLFEFLTSNLDEIGIKRNSNISKPCFLFYFDPTYIKKINFSDLFLIKITGNTLEFSLDGNEVRDSFQISDITDWDDLYSMICMTIDLWIDYHCELVFENAKQELKKILNINSNSENLKIEVNKLERKLLSIITREEITKVFNSSKTAKKLNVQVSKLSDIVLSHQDEILIPLYFEKHLIWVLQVGDIHRGGVSEIFWMLYNIFFRFHSLDKSQQIRKKWEGVFSLIDTPLVIIDESQHLEVYNREFIALNLSQKKCLGLIDNEQIEIDSESFHIQKKMISVNQQVYTLINFIPVSNELIITNTSAEELGIVSSSLAHELNNPLAGIVAALTVLSMDELDEDIVVRIEEMKNGVDRCKELVETFLGFSRVHSNSPFDHSKTVSVRRTLDQALELMRFRMIENNLKFSVSYQQKNEFLSPFNPSIFSMLFYLIFGELVTSFSHYALISGRELDVIHLIILEQNKSLTIMWDENYSLSGSFVKSKLIQHLVESQYAKMEISKFIKLQFQ